MSTQRIRQFCASFIGGAVSLLRLKGDDLLPPRKLIDGVGGGDFKALGKNLFRHLTEIGGLKPHHRVLDVGCGCGRMAVPMIPYLSGPGEYYGFDIVEEAVCWSQKHIQTKYPRFHFELADVYNQHYNSKGRCKPSEYRFSHEDNFFDFTFLTSVFTHMLATEMEHYLSEIVRTLKSGGRCLISLFLLNEESKALMDEGATPMQFRHSLPNCMVKVKDVPEAAVAYEETFIRECFAKRRLNIVEPIHFGSWPGRKKFLNYQDLVLAVKDDSSLTG